MKCKIVQRSPRRMPGNKKYRTTLIIQKHESVKFINSLAACVFPLPQWLCFNDSIRPHLLWKERKPLLFESKSHCAPQPLCHGPGHHDIGQTQSMHIRHQCLVHRTRLIRFCTSTALHLSLLTGNLGPNC